MIVNGTEGELLPNDDDLDGLAKHERQRFVFAVSVGLHSQQDTTLAMVLSQIS